MRIDSYGILSPAHLGAEKKKKRRRRRRKLKIAAATTIEVKFYIFEHHIGKQIEGSHTLNLIFFNLLISRRRKCPL